MWELLPIILSIGLFVITLIIIFTLRESTGGKRQSEAVRRRMIQYMADIKRSEDTFREHVEEMSVRLEQSKAEFSHLFTTIASQREEIFSHTQDLENLQKTLTLYYQHLGELSTLSERAESKILYVKEEIGKVEETKKVIESFLLTIATTEQQIETLTNRVEKVVLSHERTFEQMAEESVELAKVQIEEFYQSTIGKTDFTFQKVINTTNAYVEELSKRVGLFTSVIEQLNAVGEGSFDALYSNLENSRKELEQNRIALENIVDQKGELSSAIEALTTQKESLIEEINEHVGIYRDLEHKTFEIEDQLEQAYAEKERLLKERETIEFEKELSDYIEEERSEGESELLTDYEYQEEGQLELSESEEFSPPFEEPLDTEKVVAELDDDKEEISVVESEEDFALELDEKIEVPTEKEGRITTFEPYSGSVDTEFYDFSEDEAIELFFDEEQEDEQVEEKLETKSAPPLPRIESDYYEREEGEEEIILDESEW